MSKRILVLPAPKEISEINKLFGEEVEIIRGHIKEIEFHFNHELVILHKGINIKNYDFVWLSSVFGSRDISRAISVYLDHHKVSHTEVKYGNGVSKLVDITSFELNGLPIPDTFFQQTKYISEKVQIIQRLCGFPLIIKDIQGARGLNTFLARDEENLLEILQDLPKHKWFVFQKFIPNNFDWGILVADNKVVSAEKSYPPNGEFRNNACWGAYEKFEEIDNVDNEVKEIALNACCVLNLNWGRADIIVDKHTNKPYLLEFNRFPGMTSNSTEVGAFYNYLKSRLIENDLF